MPCCERLLKESFQNKPGLELAFDARKLLRLTFRSIPIWKRPSYRGWATKHVDEALQSKKVAAQPRAAEGQQQQQQQQQQQEQQEQEQMQLVGLLAPLTAAAGAASWRAPAEGGTT